MKRKIVLHGLPAGIDLLVAGDFGWKSPKPFWRRPFWRRPDGAYEVSLERDDGSLDTGRQFKLFVWVRETQDAKGVRRALERMGIKVGNGVVLDDRIAYWFLLPGQPTTEHAAPVNNVWGSAEEVVFRP